MSRTPVSNISCERTVYGYILRQSSRPLRIALLTTVIPLSCLFLMTFMMEPAERLTYLLLVVGSMALLLLTMPPLFLLAKGQRLELDREGVHLRFDLRRGKTLYWEDIQDWGFGYTVTKYGKSYFLYFSPTRLASAGSDNKKFFGVKGILTVGIAKQDYLALSRSGFLAFCREHLGDEEDMTDRYVPMFRSDITESLHED